MNLVSPHCVGDYFILQVDQNSGDSITNLKLQKLCYYAQAWSYALREKPLFVDKIKAWAHGPVIPSLYQRFKPYRWNAIDPSDLRSDPYEDLHKEDLLLLSSVWDRYGMLSGKQLEWLTHSEAPWKMAYGDRKPGSACNEEIKPEAMLAFYKGQLASTH